MERHGSYGARPGIRLWATEEHGSGIKSEMYTERLLDHYRHPRNKGDLPDADRVAEEYNDLCGDRVRIALRLERDRIVAARFEGRGCALCLGAASILTEIIQGKTLAELRAMDRDSFLAELGAEPRPSRRRCALLPWVAFRRAAYGEGK